MLVQEIFGVTDHIRELCDGFAADGYEVIAPSFFDRQERGFEAGYDADGVAKGPAYSEAAPWDQVQGDLQAAVDALKAPGQRRRLCWGGTAAWLAACRCDGVAAASGYYGRRIPELIGETPRCPTILHFGKRDPSIPPEVVETDPRRLSGPAGLCLRRRPRLRLGPPRRLRPRQRPPGAPAHPAAVLALQRRAERGLAAGQHPGVGEVRHAGQQVDQGMQQTTSSRLRVRAQTTPRPRPIGDSTATA